jgi:hypothetical protein
VAVSVVDIHARREGEFFGIWHVGVVIGDVPVVSVVVVHDQHDEFAVPLVGGNARQ